MKEFFKHVIIFDENIQPFQSLTWQTVDVNVTIYCVARFPEYSRNLLTKTKEAGDVSYCQSFE